MKTKERAESMLGRITALLAHVLQEKGPEVLLAIGGILIDLINKFLLPDGKIWKEEIAKFLRKEMCWTPATRCLRRLYPKAKIRVHPRNGTKERIVDATDVFDFSNGIGLHGFNENLEDNEAGTVEVQIWEQTLDAVTAPYLFQSLGRWPHEMTLSQSQIIYFCRKFKKIMCQTNQHTFFLYRSGGKFYLADCIGIKKGTLSIHRSDLFPTFPWPGFSYHHIGKEYDYCPNLPVRIVVPNH